MIADTVDYAALYDHLRRQGYHAGDETSTHLRPYVSWIVRRLPFDSVLDIGCSSGGSLALLAGGGRRAAGVDVSAIAVERARALGRDVVQASATRLPFDDRSFDLVVSADTFEHLHPDDVDAAAAEALRVARRWLFLKIATQEDVLARWKAVAGHALHLTIRPLDWWIARFAGDGHVVCRRDDTFCLALDASDA